MLLCVAAVSNSWVGATSSAANSAFIGDWKLDPSRSKLTDVMKVERIGAAKYVFNFGGGPQTIVVDGTDQPGGFGSTLSVAPENRNTWRVIRKRDGRLLISARWTLSADGNTLTDHYTGFDASGTAHSVNYVYRRKTPGSGFSAEWVSMSETVNSVIMLEIRPYADDGLSFIEPSVSLTRNLKFDGKDYPNLGPNIAPGSTSSIRRLNEHTLEITCKIGGSVVYTQQIELSMDLNTLTIVRYIVGQSESNVRVFNKQ